MPTFKARFVSDCASCGKPIQPGQFMSWNPRGDTKRKHFNCLNVAEIPTSAEPTIPSVPSAPSANGNGSPDIASAILSAIQPHLKMQLDEAKVREIATSVIAEELEGFKLPQPLRVEVTNPNQQTVTIDNAHKQFPELLSLCAERLDVYSYGASGGGKTTAAMHVAKALSLPFYAISLNVQSTPSLLIGFRNAQGEYIPTDFRKWYEFGGVFLFDEYDNTSGNLQTTLNTALDNGQCSFPDGLIKRHPDAVCIAAGNTVGLGANGTYSSRQLMDSAARERFVFLKWEYDSSLETNLARAINPKDGELWATWIQLVRLHVESLNLKLLVSPRATFKGAKLLPLFPASQVAELVLFKGCDTDTRTKVLASNPLPKVGA